MMMSVRFRGGTRLVMLLAGLLLGCDLPRSGGVGWRPRFGPKNRESKTDTEMSAAAAADLSVDLSEYLFRQSQKQTPVRPQDDAFLKEYFPQYTRLPDSIQLLLAQLKAMILYEPPVGIVAILAVTRLFWTGRIFRVYKQDPPSAEGVLTREETKTTKRRRKSIVRLDADDRAYDTYGGVDGIRRKLCWSALNGIVRNDDETPPQVIAAIDALAVSYTPGSSPYTFVEQLAEPLSKLLKQVLAAIAVDDVKPKNHNVKLKDKWDKPKEEVDWIVQISAKTAEIRALDALLRLSRDNLLTTSLRLRRNRTYWMRRVKMNAKLGWIFHRVMAAASMEGDRMRLASASAAFQAVVARLGSLQKVLTARPEDMSDKALLDSLSRSNKADATGEKETIHVKQDPRKKSWKTRALETALPKLSKYSLRFNAEGKGRLSFRVHDGDTVIRSDVAWEILLRSDDFDPKQWMEDAHDWTKDARSVLCRVLKASVEASIFNEKEAKKDLNVIEKWCHYDCETCDDLVKQWLAILDLAEGLDQRRVSEGKEIRIAESGLRFWTDRVNVFGIPSSLVAVGLAKLAHIHLSPFWPKCMLAAKESFNIAWNIFENWFWEPFYGIVQDLINKDSGVLEAFDVENEEKSLDNMLEDLGLGDGTAQTRKEALQGASRLYEEQLAHGVIRSAVRGRLVRLLLIQAQQLKAGLLHAMSSIDVLVAANRLNIQLLAAIPAVLIVYVGTRLMYRSLFTIKTKSLDSIRDVHAEMADYLDDMEVGLLTSTPTTMEQNVNGTTPTTGAVIHLQPLDLGEFVLCVYSYLILLEYASALFPHRATSAIRKAMQDLVASHRLGVDRRVALLRLIKQKHMDLLKYL